MEVVLYDYKFNLSDDYILGAKLFYYIHNEALECSEKMLNAYRSYNSINELITYGPKAKDKIYFRTIEDIVENINQMGIYSVNVDFFKNECQKYWGNFENAFSEIYEKYLELCGEKELAKKYREYRKQSRGQLAGGGFGVSGATKGMIMAGVANMTTGIFHSVFNVIDGAFTNANINSRIESLINDPNNEKALSKAVYDDIFNIIYPIIDILEENNDFTMEYDIKNYEKANIILENIYKNRIPEDDLKHNVVEMIRLSPFDPENYSVAYQLFEDENDELERLSKELSVDIDLTGYKNIEKNAETFFGKDYDEVIKYAGKTVNAFFDKKLNDPIYVMSNDPKIRKKFKSAERAYAFLDKDEIPLICFDNTVFGSAKEGCLITSKGIHIHNTLSKPKKFLFGDISKIEVKGQGTKSEKLFINDYELQTSMLRSAKANYKFCSMLNEIAISMKI